MSSNKQIVSNLDNQQKNLSSTASCGQRQGDGTKKLISIDGATVHLPFATAKHLKKYALSPNNNNGNIGTHCIAASASDSGSVVIRHKAKKLSSVDENEQLMEEDWFISTTEGASSRPWSMARSNSLGTKSPMETADTASKSITVKDDDANDTVAFRSSNKKCRRGNSVRFSDHLEDNDGDTAADAGSSFDYANDDKNWRFVESLDRKKTSLPAAIASPLTAMNVDGDAEEVTIFSSRRQRSLLQRHKFSMPAYGTTSSTAAVNRSVDDSYRSGGCGRMSPRLFLYQSRRRPTTSSNTLYSLSTEYLRAAGYQTPPFCKLLSIKRKKGTVSSGVCSFDVEQQRSSTGRGSMMADVSEQNSARRLLSLDDKKEYSSDPPILGASSLPSHFFKNSKNNSSQLTCQDNYQPPRKKSLIDRRKFSNFFFQNRCVSESGPATPANIQTEKAFIEKFAAPENFPEIAGCGDKRKKIEFSVLKKKSNCDLEENVDERRHKSAPQSKNLRSRYSYGRVYVQDSLTQKMLFKKRRNLFDKRLTICKFSLLFAALGLLLAVLETEMTSSGATSKKDFGSYLIRSTIMLTTLILDGLILAYHWIEIKISMIDITAHDWRVVITSRDIAHLVIEIIICSVCPIPINITVSWVILSPHHRRTRLTVVPFDSVLSILMFLRCYLIGRFMALNSVQFKDAATRSIARLNRVTVNFAFVMKSLMSRHPIRVLSGFTVMFWICMSWILAQCERFTNIPADNDYLNCVWFVVITFMSIGYGDVVPATYCGRTVAITTGIVGAGVSSALIAVMSMKLELSRAEKHVNNFMTDTKLNRQRKEAAASILQHTWFIHKWKMATNYAEETKLRYHQRKLIGAISEFRRIKWEQRRLTEQGNALIDVAKLQSDMSNTLWEMHQSQLALTFQINRLSHRFRLLGELVSSSSVFNKADPLSTQPSTPAAMRGPPVPADDPLATLNTILVCSETDAQVVHDEMADVFMRNLVNEPAQNVIKNTLSPKVSIEQ
uniref:Calmodulin-binding domain-containing protein n=1 Tax=Romanomermis culicivorax TaxID=13658 RepID=A0A915L9X9_ROMCU